MSDFRFVHGDTIEDIITGFKGIVTGRADYITGCNQYSVTGRVEKDGAKQEHGHMWLDENRVKLDGAIGRMALPTLDQDNEDPIRKRDDNGGPQDTPSKQ